VGSARLSIEGGQAAVDCGLAVVSGNDHRDQGLLVCCGAVRLAGLSGVPHCALSG
jgi:hypothetical protein